MSPAVEIFPPTAADVPTLVDLGARTFSETFVGMQYYTQSIVDEYNAQTFTPEAMAREIDDPKISYLLLTVDGEPLGYAKLVEREPAECLAGLRGMYLQRLYFLRAAQRRGLGTVLMAAVDAEARRRGYEWMWLSVWEYNEPAVAFYAKHGFTLAGEWDWAFEAGGRRYVDRDRVMVRRLPPESPASTRT